MMEKLAIKIPMLSFFLAVVYFASKGFDVMDAVIRAFMLAFGVALIMLVLTMVIIFFLTLQTNKAKAPLAGYDNREILREAESLRGKKAEVQT
jgi:hypothetical protein